MPILRHQDAGVSVQTQKNKNFCWAACIEMVTAKYNESLISERFQCTLAQKQVELLKGKVTIHFDPKSCLDCGALGDTGLKKGKNLYPKLFKEVCRIDCTQYKVKTFPDWRYMEEQTANGLPVIISGIYIPSCLGASHAVVITGCFLEKNHSGHYIHWVLANDPYVPNPCQSQKARKTAWIYDELKKSHKEASAENSIDGKVKPLIYVSGFQPSLSGTSKIKRTKKTTSFSRNDGTYQVFTDAQLDSQVGFLMESLFGKQKNSFLFNYFGFKKGKKMTAKGLVPYKSVDGTKKFSDESPVVTIASRKNAGVTISQKELEIAKQGANLSILPIYQEGEPIIDIFIQHDGDDKNRILGIQEHQSNDIIPFGKESQEEGAGVVFDFDHNTPNYTIVDIAPFGFRFMVYERDGKTFYAPVANYPSIGAECAASLPAQKITEALNTKLPVADDSVDSY